MIIDKPHLCTKIDIWAPRYKDKYNKALAEPVVLIAKYKVFHSNGTIIVNFTKAKHLKGLHYAIKTSTVMRYPTDTNGKIACFAVPLSALEEWQSGYEMPKEPANPQANIFENLELGL